MKKHLEKVPFVNFSMQMSMNMDSDFCKLQIKDVINVRSTSRQVLQLNSSE